MRTPWIDRKTPIQLRTHRSHGQLRFSRIFAYLGRFSQALVIVWVTAVLETMPSRTHASGPTAEICRTFLQFSAFDPRANESAYEKLVTEMLNSGFSDGTGFRRFFSGLSDPRLQEFLNKATLGIFGHIEKPRVSPNGKIRWERDPSEIQERRARFLESEDYRGLDRERPLVQLGVLQGSPTGISIRPLGTDHVVASFMNMVTESKTETPGTAAWGSALRGRFMLSYLRLNAKAYRKDSLIPDEPLSGFKMLDEYTENLAGLNIGEAHLVFHRQVWEAEVTALNRMWQKYSKMEPSSKEAQDFLVEIQQGGPFFASLGLTVGREFFGVDPDVEFRGLFSNDSPDPLGILPGSVEAPRNLSVLFYIQVIENLVPFSKIDVHAHTDKHLRFYTRMGFGNPRYLYSPRWKRPITELTQTRENLLKYFRGLLP